MPMTMVEKICEICGNEYEVGANVANRSRFCPRCREEAEKEYYRQRAEEEEEKKRQERWMKDWLPRNGTIYEMQPREEWGYAKGLFTATEIEEMMRMFVIEEGTIFTNKKDGCKYIVKKDLFGNLRLAFLSSPRKLILEVSNASNY